MKRLSLALLVLMFCTISYAQDTLRANPFMAKLTPEAIMTWVYLIGISILGIALHWLIDLKKAQAQCLEFSFIHYVGQTWVSSLISFIICIIAILIRHELTNLPSFSAWEGGAMALLGYSGDSILPLVFGFAKSKGFNIGGDCDNPQKEK